MKLAVDEANEWVIVTREDGRVHRYMKNPTGATRPCRRVRQAREARGRDLLLKTKDRVVFDFDEYGGVLQKITDRTATRPRSPIVDGKLSSVTAPDGRQLSFPMTPLGIIATSRIRARGPGPTRTASRGTSPRDRPEGGITRYTYDAKHQLLTLKDAEGRTVVTNTYNDEGRVTEQLDARGEKTVYAYDIANKRTFVTDPLGARPPTSTTPTSASPKRPTRPAARWQTPTTRATTRRV